MKEVQFYNREIKITNKEILIIDDRVNGSKYKNIYLLKFIMLYFIIILLIISCNQYVDESFMDNRDELVKYLTNSDGWYSFGVGGGSSDYYFYPDGRALASFGSVSSNTRTDWDGKWSVNNRTVRISYYSKSGYGRRDDVFKFDAYPVDDGTIYSIALKRGTDDYLYTENEKRFKRN